MEKKRKALRKLLEAVEKEILKKPDRKTLDHLSLLVGFQDWESFQNALYGDASADENYKYKKEMLRLQASLLFHESLSYSPTGRRFSLMRAALPVSLRR